MTDTTLNLTRAQRADLRADWPARHRGAEADDHMVRVALRAPTDAAALAMARAAFSPVTRPSKVDGAGGLAMNAAVIAARRAAHYTEVGLRQAERDGRDAVAALGVTLTLEQGRLLVERLRALARDLRVHVFDLATLRALEAASPARVASTRRAERAAALP